MNKKTIAALIGAAIITIALFLLPNLLLRWEQNAVELSLQNDLSAQLSSSETMDLFAKLQFLSDINLNLQMLQFKISDEQAQEVKNIFLQEITKLHQAGYAGGGISWDELLAKPHSVVSCVIVDADRVLRGYQIQMPSVQVLIDMQTHKILQITSGIATWERADDALNMTENGHLLSMKSLEAFAKYYGFRVENTVASYEYQGKENGWAIVSASFINNESESVSFGLSFNITYDFISWGAINDEIEIAEEENPKKY